MAPFLAEDELLEIDGSVTKAPPPPLANPPAVPNDWALPSPPAPVKLSTQEISDTLDDLFTWPPAAASYGTYFLSLPRAIRGHFKKRERNVR